MEAVTGCLNHLSDQFCPTTLNLLSSVYVFEVKKHE